MKQPGFCEGVWLFVLYLSNKSELNLEFMSLSHKYAMLHKGYTAYLRMGKQFNVEEVLIQGGKRTTGKYKGTVPTPITIKVND